MPRESIQRALHEMGIVTPRKRKLCLESVVFLVIAMNLFADAPIGYVLRKMAQGRRLLGLGEEDACAADLPKDSALVYRRYQLGVRPMLALFRCICRPIATKDTPGAFLLGLRLMALDGQQIDVPDTPENRACFGKLRGSRGEAAFVKVQALYLCECGTHAMVDAGFWPVGVGEHKGAHRLLRSVKAGMLVMWDRGLFAFRHVRRVRQQGGHVLCRLSSHLKPVLYRRLPDGTWLAWIFPSQSDRRHKDDERLLVRLIEYTVTDPKMPGYKEHYRLLSTLLEPDKYAARELAVAYHERWEIEITLDEIEVHQHLCDGPLRSKKPVGVLQELYGLVIAHWAIRFLMHEAAMKAGLDPDRLSFTHSLRVIGDAVRDFSLAAPQCLPLLYARLLEDIASRPLPARRARSNPRVVKRKMSNFALKREEHKNLPKLEQSFQEAIVLI